MALRKAEMESSCVVLAARARKAAGGDWLAALEEDFTLLADSRPTAVNLFWALNRMRDRLARSRARADGRESGAEKGFNRQRHAPRAAGG